MRASGRDSAAAATGSQSGTVRAWLELLRVPNLPTVPGDPLAGLLLAGAAGSAAPSARQAGGVMLASLLLYMAGLVLNDLHDLPEDRVRRPERPLPRGAIAKGVAGAAFVCFAAFGPAAAFLGGGPRTGAAAVILLGLICLYDLAAKRFPAAGCLVMGLCRGASLAMGACAGGRVGAAVWPACALACHIAAVTWLSRREDEVHRPGPLVLVPPLALGLGCAAAALICPPLRPVERLLFLACAGLAVTSAGRLSLGLFRRPVAPGQARSAVGRFIGLLLPWQGSLAAAAGGPAGAAAAVALLAAWPLSRRLLRWASPS